MTLEIRSARPADAAVIAAISLRGWQAAYADILPREVLEERDPMVVRESWREYVDAVPNGEGLIVADDDGEVVGFARFGPCLDDDVPSAGEVYGLYVEPGRTGGGIGTLLLTDAVSRLATEFDAVVVWTFAGNTGAIRFYEHAGLARDGLERPEEDTQTLEIRLAAPLPVET